MSSPDAPLNIVEATDATALAIRLAEDVASQLHDAVQQRGAASLVVSGGGTPKPFFQALCDHDIDWGSVQITLADERCVALSSPDRNETLVRERLLVSNAASAQLIGLFDENPKAQSSEDRAQCVQRAEQLVLGIPRPFDVVVLGMGEDAHTASLFPDSEGLSLALDPENPALCQIIDPPHAPHVRMTLTLSALINCRRGILHITGDSKRQVLEASMANAHTARAPVAALIRAFGSPFDVYWSA